MDQLEPSIEVSTLAAESEQKLGAKKTMPIKSFRPITPSLRFTTTLVERRHDDGQAAQAAAGCQAAHRRPQLAGELTIRHHGGGHKQKLRLIDFKRDKYGVPGNVATIEYDPNRCSRIALVTMPTARSATSFSRLG